MGIAIDLVIIGIILLGIILGYIKGLSGSLIKILSLIIALIISLILFKPISILIVENSKLDENLQSSIYNLIIHNKNMGEVDKTSSSNSMPDIVKNYIANNIQNAKNEAQEVIATTISKNIAISIINLGVLITLFIVSRIVMLFVKGITDLITKIPVIKQFDKIGGIIYGGFESLIFIYIIFLIILLFNNFITRFEILEIIQQSFLGNIMYNNNLLLKIFFNK